jgi:hypothetical protein
MTVIFDLIPEDLISIIFLYIDIEKTNLKDLSLKEIIDIFPHSLQLNRIGRSVSYWLQKLSYDGLEDYIKYFNWDSYDYFKEYDNIFSIDQNSGQDIRDILELPEAQLSIFTANNPLDLFYKFTPDRLAEEPMLLDEFEDEHKTHRLMIRHQDGNLILVHDRISAEVGIKEVKDFLIRLAIADVDFYNITNLEKIRPDY